MTLLESIQALPPGDEITIPCATPNCDGKATVTAGGITTLQSTGWWLTAKHHLCCPKCRPEDAR